MRLFLYLHEHSFVSMNVWRMAVLHVNMGAYWLLFPGLKRFFLFNKGQETMWLQQPINLHKGIKVPLCYVLHRVLDSGHTHHEKPLSWADNYLPAGQGITDDNNEHMGGAHGKSKTLISPNSISHWSPATNKPACFFRGTKKKIFRQATILKKAFSASLWDAC